MPPKLPTKKSASLYFPNGDIVLQSLPKKNGVATAFKVERAVLLQASSAFEKILDLSSASSQDAGSYDHVPMVKLQDEPDHLTTFLTALYDPRSIEWGLYDYEINKVEGILLLATKYEVDQLRKHVISILERDWPLKLDDWDKNEADISSRYEEEEIGMVIPDPCAIIRLTSRTYSDES